MHILKYFHETIISINFSGKRDREKKSVCRRKRANNAHFRHNNGTWLILRYIGTFRYNGRSAECARKEGFGGIGVVLANGGALLPSNIRLLISLILTHVKQ